MELEDSVADPELMINSLHYVDYDEVLGAPQPTS
jgi:hypothetical protein